MEYLALVYDNPDAWERMSEAEQASAYEGYMAVAREAEAAGALVDAARASSRPAAATSVRVRNGEALVTDGPVRRGEGVARRLLPVLVRLDRRGDRVGGEDPVPPGTAVRSRSGPSTSKRRQRHEVRDARLQRPVRRGRGSPKRRRRRLRAESMPRWIALFEEMGKADPNVQGRELARGVRGEGRPRRRRADDRHRRPLRRDEGAARRHLRHGAPRPRRGDPARRPRPGSGVRHARDPAARDAGERPARRGLCRGMAAVRRHPDPRPRRSRTRRGRGAGRVRDCPRALAPQRCARQPGRLDRDHRPQPRHRPDPA